MFLISSISALDAELPSCQGGDEELIICFGDEGLTWLAGLLPSVGGGGGGSIEPIVEKPEIPVVVEKKIIDWVLISLCVILCFILCLLIFRKKKCSRCGKRFRKRDMKKYNNKWYCKSCYGKLRKQVI